MQALNTTNQRLQVSNKQLSGAMQYMTQVLTQRIQQERDMAQYFGYLSQQLDGLAKRIDDLDVQVSTLSQILAEDDLRALPPASIPQVSGRRPFIPPAPFVPPTPGQMLGGVVGYAADQLYGSSGRGRGR